jgi:hypothetical protein
MLIARKENFEEDVLANFRMKNSGSSNIPDKYEGNDIYEDKADKKNKDNIPSEEIEITPRKSPNESPNKSPYKSPKKSPYKSPTKNIYISPKKKGILKKKNLNSPPKSPIKSPKKVIIN